MISDEQYNELKEKFEKLKKSITVRTPILEPLNKHESVVIVNEFDDTRYENTVNNHLNDGYKLHSSSCQPNSEGDMVWGAVLLLEVKS